jgi:hypothetical protein
VRRGVPALRVLVHGEEEGPMGTAAAGERRRRRLAGEERAGPDARGGRRALGRKGRAGRGRRPCSRGSRSRRRSRRGPTARR